MRIFYDKRFLAVLWVVTVWAMLYLPSLDTADASRNECRRILPAITMLETGNWGTPMLSGKPYLRKPPMMNWFIASAYAITGMRSVLTARFATTLFVLALALTMLLLPSQLFDFNIRIVVSTALLVTFGMIGLGRSADIDPNYVCCAGFAVLFWLDAWSRNR
ncbi:MAG: glycosyltransferase family 39 protein, partial [Victivallales bacterium]|nr:glycosyltransferase family 39 protein [Victivallales bacterium]